MPKDEKEKLVPNLRFKGFTDDWIQEKLGNYVTFYSGLTYSPKNVVESDNGTLVLRSSNIQDDTLDFSDNVYVNQEAVNSKYVEKNDIVVVVRNGSRRLLGKHVIIKNELKNTVIGAFMTGIQAKSPYFINSLLSTKTFEKEMYKDLGATINQITNKNFKNMTFNVPQIEEADNIGDLFQKLDTIITLEQEKLIKYEQAKENMLTKLFPIRECKIPKLRFKPFNENWRHVKLNDIIDSYSGGTPSANNTNYYGGNIPFIRSGEISKDYTKLYLTEKGLDNSSAKMVSKGDVLYALYGATSGEVSISKINGAINQAILAIIPQKNFLTPIS